MKAVRFVFCSGVKVESLENGTERCVSDEVGVSFEDIVAGGSNFDSGVYARSLPLPLSKY